MHHVEPFDEMRERRGIERAEDLCNGPGKLTQALGIWLDLNGTPLTGGPIEILPREAEPEIVTGTRIGITKAADWPLRWYIAGNPYVSKTPSGFPLTRLGG